MSVKGGVTGFVEKMMQLTMNRQENIPEPNLKARIFAAVHFILCRCYGCPFLGGIVEDRGWPCARLFQRGEAIYTLDDREMRVTILNDASFYYLYVYFPPTETSYFILDISQPIVPLFESTNEEDEVPVDGKAFTLDVSIHVNFVRSLSSRIGSDILNKMYVLVSIPAYYVLLYVRFLGFMYLVIIFECRENSVIRKNEFSMILISFSIPKKPKGPKKRKAAASEATSSDPTVRAKTSDLHSEILKLVPNNCNIGSKLMGSILFIACDVYACTLDTERHEWPVVLDYLSQN